MSVQSTPAPDGPALGRWWDSLSWPGRIGIILLAYGLYCCVDAAVYVTKEMRKPAKPPVTSLTER